MNHWWFKAIFLQTAKMLYKDFEKYRLPKGTRKTRTFFYLRKSNEAGQTNYWCSIKPVRPAISKKTIFIELKPELTRFNYKTMLDHLGNCDCNCDWDVLNKTLFWTKTTELKLWTGFMNKLVTNAEVKNFIHTNTGRNLHINKSWNIVLPKNTMNLTFKLIQWFYTRFNVYEKTAHTSRTQEFTSDHRVHWLTLNSIVIYTDLETYCTFKYAVNLSFKLIQWIGKHGPQAQKSKLYSLANIERKLHIYKWCWEHCTFKCTLAINLMYSYNQLNSNFTEKSFFH